MIRALLQIRDADGGFREDSDPLFLPCAPRPGDTLSGQYGLLIVKSIDFHLAEDQLHLLLITCHPQEDTEHH